MGSDSDVIERHLVGDYVIPVDKMITPLWKRLCRHPDQSHVDALAAKFKGCPGGQYTILAVHIPGLALGLFKSSKLQDYTFEVIGGNHTRLALQKLNSEANGANYKTAMARVFCDLPDNLARRIGMDHNKIHFAMPPSAADLLFSFRAAAYAEAGYTNEADLITVEIQLTKDKETRWKDGLITMLEIKGTEDMTPRKQFSNKHGPEIRLALSSCRIWNILTEYVQKWHEGGILCQPKKGTHLKTCHLKFLDGKTDEVKIDLLQKLIDKELEYNFWSKKKKQGKGTKGAAGVKATVTEKNTDAESEQENESGSESGSESGTEAESKQPDEGDNDKDAKIKKLEADVQTMRDQLASSKDKDAKIKKLEADVQTMRDQLASSKDKDAKIKKLEADVQTMRDQLASSKACYSEKERELKAVLDQLEEEKATSANLRYETEQSGEEQTNMLLELEGFRESPLYKVNDFVVVRGDANDGDDTVPWFAKVVAVYPSKRRLTLRWHVPNEEGVYTREIKGGKDLKDDITRFDDIVTTVQMSKDMKLPVKEYEKAWEAVKQATE
ncbi:Hypp6814 [Branchiostoma lanceolatum]|uniref:Hypp6814 protein n=1 Tax=Branchiostoma lanceolatum TaxID=7740 RepID=A0A8K0EB69_BRALA|nr:Hypp6814 [Branchiostoma lanceolatum]